MILAVSRFAPSSLLNRWIVPLEKRYDYLNLTSGRKIQVPFDQFLVFSTNLEPRELVDEAFLRRIPYKIDVCDPTEQQFRSLFLGTCRGDGNRALPATTGLPYPEVLSRHRPCDAVLPPPRPAAASQSLLRSARSTGPLDDRGTRRSGHGLLLGLVKTAQFSILREETLNCQTFLLAIRLA